MKRIIVAMIALSFVLVGCYTPGPHTNEGALAGGILGGVTGAVVGHQFGGALAGAAIGTGLGALTGAAIGNAHDKADAAYFRSGRTAYAAPSVEQEPQTAPPGKWVIVPGQWVGGRWVPAHKVWVPVNP